MWHCSVASPRMVLSKRTASGALREMAYEMLDGFGCASAGEWTEDRPRAFHLRRRLSAEEQTRVGEAIDCRTTVEAQQRYDAMKPMLPTPELYLVSEEVPGIVL